ncbi:MAG: multi-sensor signal transduction histidine kinase [Ilumatobacteraceae bacterium]|nr:multi-sensor signal transduction histidine kinase [Ilumatobacteraceae bacterium]
MRMEWALVMAAESGRASRGPGNVALPHLGSNARPPSPDRRAICTVVARRRDGKEDTQRIGGDVAELPIRSVVLREGWGSCHHSGVGGPGRNAGAPHWRDVGLGSVVGAIVVLSDGLSGPSIILIPLLVLAPLITSVRGSANETIAVGSAAVGFAVGLGWVDDIAGDLRHLVAIATVVVGGFLAVWFAAAREKRDAQIAESADVMRSMDRLKVSLSTGRMGEWSWNATDDSVEWDVNVLELFGVARERFGGDLGGWLALIDDRDRDLTRAELAAAVDEARSFRFDHRCMWDDGSTHWIAVIGDVAVDSSSGRVTGAFGLAVDVDEQRRQIDEGSRLAEYERGQRQRAEYLASVNEVLTFSVDLAQIIDRISNSMISNLADWCSIVLSIDRPRDRPLITVAHIDREMVCWAEDVQREHPYDPDAEWGAAGVIARGRAEFIPRVDPRLFDLPGGEVLARAMPGSIITVPLKGTLGILGALQLIRTSDKAAFSTADLEFVDELAGRVGLSLNTAILFQRLTRSRSALDTLQEVSGHISAAATREQVLDAVLLHVADGLGATHGVAFLLDEMGRPTLAAATADVDSEARELARDAATHALEIGQVATWHTPTARSDAAWVGVPLRILHRTTGCVVFALSGERELSTEDETMLATIGLRCAGALERASLYERERSVALTLQHRLLSTLPSTPTWLEAAACYVPASGLEIGGDWFQLLDAGGGRIAAIVGDAVGHGFAAAAAMGQLRASFATAVANDAEPLNALTAVDRFAELGADTMAASAAYVLLDPDTGAQYASAGHPSVLHVAAGGTVAFLDGGRGPLLGFRANRATGTEHISFSDDDLIVMYTDGLVERRREAIDTGLRRLAEAVREARHLAPQGLGEAIVAACTEGREPEDDIAVLILRRQTQDPARPRN